MALGTKVCQMIEETIYSLNSRQNTVILRRKAESGGKSDSAEGICSKMRHWSSTGRSSKPVDLNFVT